MGRQTHSRALSVWANGERVGVWRLPTRGPMEFAYDPAWVASPAGRPLSLSLPFAPSNVANKGHRVLNYFDNLLPDSEAIRKRIAQRYQTDTLDPFDLLQAIGRDCVGAVQLLAEDDAPAGVERIDGTPLSDSEIETMLARTVSTPALGAADETDDFRISLAGAQEKTALLWHDGKWQRPHGATPTTHIFKLPLGLVGNKLADLSTSVENEWLCLRILRAYGLPVANTEIMTFGKQRVLSVERFDRQLHSSGQWLLRLPQEDFCQVYGVPSHRKYENEGGPGMLDLARILQQSVSAQQDIETLLASQILFWMLAAPDGHAKNFSIRLLAGGQYRLTPLYDVMSIWPVEGNGPNQWSWFKARLAMGMWSRSKHDAFRDVQRRHFNTMALRCSYGANAEPLIQRLIEQTPEVIARVSAELPERFPGKVAERIFKGLKNSAAKLDTMPPA
ncbi:MULTISPECIES: type II toxin-antitoxin system HipA family toxin [Paraburkholderia]|jgi:serine/threonine-protein kinase HipA|uniref:Serine/threonine-protein kinase toxin HipA n=1 Tax=Paraburkholderia aspalathi TaxID=1324617 RepID=A0ABN7LWK5_9BURK|nr:MULTISPECIES: type II toxin-antitoxin system HipA family toxin [Paraburkholderia]MBK3820004.1 type II toxin-antitoxin system HipA family toxin [Paraburkholderia aspalathi]MBK3831856.1 type II toxin-antitoxin system HipA family toxin [Paraburkholderia aspalathi]MBK3861563.1 type II toxin-antitoxin system HipA family toxin [Paraburkholderia aspalathi]MCX4157144.1 type II toxin-antitoxin system HipA family toxin [Paraburkholderia aspalathi]MDN7166548.1 type II toxin-antitoxin system HipA famil